MPVVPASRAHRGSALVVALVISIVLMGMVSSLVLVSAKEGEMVLDVGQLEKARFLCEGGLNLVLEDYQKDQEPPPSSWYDSPQPLAGGTFQILKDEEIDAVTQKRLVRVEGLSDLSEWRIDAVIGPEFRSRFGAAIQANSYIHMSNNARVDSYDSRESLYDKFDPGENGDVLGNGDILMENSASIHGDLDVVGDLTIKDEAQVTGEAADGGEENPIESVDDLVAQLAAQFKDSNNNDNLDPSIVETKDGEPMIHVQANKTKVIETGDYYLHSMIIENQSTIELDTTDGPIRMVFHTEDVFLKNNTTLNVTGDHPVEIYLSGDNKFFMDNFTKVINPGGRSDLFQVVINSNGAGEFIRMENSNNATFYGTILAPDADMILQNNFDLHGAVICREIQLKNIASVHYDEALAESMRILIPESYRVHFKKRNL